MKGTERERVNKQTENDIFNHKKEKVNDEILPPSF